MQQDYEYQLTHRSGQDFAPEFLPQLSPAQMLKMGVFGGKYMTDCRDEFPKSWYQRAKLSPEGRRADLNFFGINASKSLSYWEEKNWIHRDDPRGWFQWYCRYYRGRRHPDDARQIKRWRNMTRHIAQLKRNCEPYNYACRPRQRQALLHWAYDSRAY